MIVKTSETENFAITLPITREIRHIAAQFAARQPTSAKMTQVMLNAIAVSVVNNYLSMLGIPTDLSSSDSWNPVMQLCANVADLELPEVGKLECIPLKSDLNRCQIPLEVRDLRCGYVVVQIDDDLKKATILGFTPQVMTEDLILADLQSPEALIDRIHDLRSLNVADSLVNLSQWFNNIFETGWQTIDSVFNPPQLTPVFGFRSGESRDCDAEADNSVTRAKVIDLGFQLSDRKLVLLAKLTPEVNGNMEVTLRVHCQQYENSLPEALELRVLEASGQVFMEAQARTRDNYIQLQFSGKPEERFTAEIILDELKFSEQFQI